MKVLAVHNYYQQRGGEDQCFEDEVDVLRHHGHTVVTHTAHNDSIDQSSIWQVAKDTLWNAKEYKRMLSIIKVEKPDVMHAVNTFPLLSPSIFYAAHKLGVPVVHEIANYRLTCAGAYLLRDGKICEKCVGALVPASAIVHRCYRNSIGGSTTIASSIVLHRLMRTWHRVVDLFLSPSESCRRKLIEAGLPATKIHVKPNVLNFDPGMGTGPEPFVVFVGRLSPEKGLATLLKAWRDDPQLPVVKIIGDGPLTPLIQESQLSDRRIQALGRLPIESLVSEVGKATCLLMPSIWYEPFGRTTIEAFATGTPVIGSNIGGTAELISEGINGWLFPPNDVVAMTKKIHHAMNLPASEMQRCRMAARQTYLDQYTSKHNYGLLMDAYQRVIRK